MASMTEINIRVFRAEWQPPSDVPPESPPFELPPEIPETEPPVPEEVPDNPEES